MGTGRNGDRQVLRSNGRISIGRRAGITRFLDRDLQVIASTPFSQYRLKRVILSLHKMDGNGAISSGLREPIRMRSWDGTKAG